MLMSGMQSWSLYRMGMGLVHTSLSLLPTHHMPSTQLLLPSAGSCYNPAYTHTSLISVLSHSKHAKYTSQKRSVSFWLWDRLYKDSCLIQMGIFWGACKRQAWSWSPAERFSLLIPQNCMLAVWTGPYSPPPHQKPLWNHRLFQEFIMERNSGCHLVQPPAQGRTNLVLFMEYLQRTEFLKQSAPLLAAFAHSHAYRWAVLG